MNRVKLLSAAAILLATFAGPALAEGGHGHGGGGMAMSGGPGVGGRAAPSGGATVAPSAGTFGGGMRGSSANTATGSMVRGDSGRNFVAGGDRDRGDWGRGHRGHDGRFAFGVGVGYPYGYDNSYAYYDGDCYLVRRRVLTPYGWRFRRVQVCE